jgi:ABC-2 type transport system ATP-binding protein
VWSHLRDLRERGTTVVVTTHQLGEAEYCDRIAIIDHGKLLTEGTPAELKAVIGADQVVLRTEDDVRAADAVAERFGLSAERTRDGLRLRVADGAATVPRLCAGLGLTVLSVDIRPPTLDDVFLHHTGTAIRDSGVDSGLLANLGEGLR